MKIKNVIFVAGTSSFYFDDQAAIKSSAPKDGFTYAGAPQTEGFSAIRQSGECVSILLELENGDWAQGDCAAVQYSGAGGRDPLFTAQRFIPFMQHYLRPELIGFDVSNFRTAAKFFDELCPESKQLHTAIRYGLSQALLEATALATGRLKVEVVCDEYNLDRKAEPLSLFGQSGDDRYNSVDKMVMKNVDVLPHALINNVPDKLGHNGEKLFEYVEWLSKRVQKLRSSDAYSPQLHIDVYGTIGMIFNNDPVKIAKYIASLEPAAKPFDLYIEGPVDVGNKADQITTLKAIRAELKNLDSTVKIVADEWCNTLYDIQEFVNEKCCDMVQIKTPDLGSIHNTIEAVLYCHEHQVEAYQGGTCNETDISAKCCVHIAQATRPTRLLVKPGMGFDEGLMIVGNEMARNSAIIEANNLKVQNG